MWNAGTDADRSPKRGGGVTRGAGQDDEMLAARLAEQFRTLHHPTVPGSYPRTAAVMAVIGVPVGLLPRVRLRLSALPSEHDVGRLVLGHTHEVLEELERPILVVADDEESVWLADTSGRPDWYMNDGLRSLLCTVSVFEAADWSARVHGEASYEQLGNLADFLEEGIAECDPSALDHERSWWGEQLSHIRSGM